MDVLALLLKLSHVAVAMTLVAGLIGRSVLLRRAASSTDVEEAARLADLAGPFERLVIISSMLVLPVGLLTAWAQGYEWLGLTTLWMGLSVVIVIVVMLTVPTIFVPRGRVFETALAEARARGVVTGELRAAFADPTVRVARTMEAVGIAVIVALMVVKPTL
jgi:Predicted integral membrane protein (DUF2269)